MAVTYTVAITHTPWCDRQMPTREYSKLSFLCSKCSIFSTHTLLQLVFFETQQLQAGSHLTNKWNHLCRCRDFDLAFCLLGSVLYYYEYWIYRTLSYRGGCITTAFLSPRASLARFFDDEQIRTRIKRTQIKERISSGLSSLFTVSFSDVLPTMRAPFSDT